MKFTVSGPEEPASTAPEMMPIGRIAVSASNTELFIARVRDDAFILFWTGKMADVEMRKAPSCPGRVYLLPEKTKIELEF